MNDPPKASRPAKLAGLGAFARLHCAADRLIRAHTPLEVAKVAVAEGMAATNARGGAAYLTDEAGDLVRVHTEPPAELPVHFPPLANALPGEWPPLDQPQALVVLPLRLEGRGLGALRFSFREPRTFDAAERAFLLALAQQVSQAFDRARLLDAERRGRLEAEGRQRRAALLSDASALLAGLESDGLAASLAELVVPRIADVCLVALPRADGDGMEEWVLARADRPEPVRGERRADPSAAPAAPALVSDLSVEGALEAALPRAPDRERLVWAGVRSAMVAPVTARGRTSGSIALGAKEPGRFENEDLDLLDELARRTGLAVENARLYREARAAERRKDEFLAMLGHELRNPLAPIRTALQLMRMRQSDAFERERGVIERQVEHVVRLVDDLLDVSRITRGKIELKRERVEIGAVVARAIEMTSPLFERALHHLVLCAPDEPLWVMGDAARLAQVVANLLNNAAKYTERGGRIAVSAGREDGQAVVRVRDSGTGIAPEMLPRVFDLFVQEPRSSDRAQGGLGLGLTIVRSLVELHGGEVTAHSEGAGRGTELVVRLPVLPQAAAAAPGESPRPPAEQPAAAGPARVLLVDDNVDAGEMVAEALASVGYEPVVVHDGPAALEAARRRPPDLALLDIGLPVMDGYELAERLRREHGARAPRMVAVTGYGQPSDRERSRLAGFDAHLVKPLDLNELLALLARLGRAGAPPSGARPARRRR